MAQRNRFERFVIAWWPAFVLALASIWVVQPMHHADWWASHESIWYPVRVHEYVQSWEAGIWYPRWCPNLYGGYGYPFLNYYAPGVYFSAASVAQIGSVGPVVALKVLVTVVTIASAVGAYGMLRSETGRTDAALLGGACYVFLPYRCTDLFARGDIAEYCAYCIVPFVLWSYRGLARSSGRRAALIGCAAALTHAGVLLTHTLIGMFTTELVGLYIVILLCRKERSRALIASVVMLFAIALAAVYVVPAFFERNLVFLERVTGDRYTPWLNAVSPRALRDPFFTPGWPFFIGFAAWLGSFLLPRGRNAAIRAAVPWAIASAMVVLMFPGVVSIWKIVPFGAEVQFPWRLLGFIGLFAALGMAIWWAHLLPARPIVLAVAIMLCLPMPLLLTVQRRVAPSHPVPVTDAQIQAAFGTSTVMDEYLPRRVQQPPTAPRSQAAWSDDSALNLRVLQLDDLHHQIELEATRETIVTLSIFGFRGWKVRTLEGPTSALMRFGSKDGLLRVVLPKAGRYKVIVYFGQTWFRIGATVISLLGLLLLYPVLSLLVKRTERARASR